VRRADGQVIQMSQLLCGVACRIDGFRSPAAIAKLVSGDLGRSPNADQVRYLITEKLLPLGIVTTGDAPAAVPKANPLLALKARGTLPERAADAAGALLRPLFRWPLVVAVVGSVLAVDYWLFAADGLGGGLTQVMRDPVDLLVVVGLSVASAAFHECGHAAGCRYGGARPGVIGVGIYLLWPAFFTNVTDSYRLSRTGRLRTDLGGLYVNAVFILALAGLYAATTAGFLLVVIAVTTWRCWNSCSRSSVLTATSSSATWQACRICSPESLLSSKAPCPRPAGTHVLSACGAAPGSS
jgi:putative peptide zinc metalloprotease protein